jgi:hypothetical protein
MAARRMTSGMILKHSKGERLGILSRYETASPRLKPRSFDTASHAGSTGLLEEIAQEVADN